MKTVIFTLAVGALLASPAFAAPKTVTVSQHNLVNGSVVGLMGNGTSVSVTQSGIVNASVVVQLGNFSKAQVSQTGVANGSTINQGF
jgi:hypothetical protein